MTAEFLVGDVRERQAELIAAGERFDFLLCSPPFLALRSYLPPDHPDKAKEIGSEATPAEFLDVLLELTAEWGRLLAPHGSIAIELGDTYAGSGGAGGDYGPDGLREGQPSGWSQANSRRDKMQIFSERVAAGGAGWPLDKSLACIPQLYQVALAYGINPLTGRESPAGRWRVRNLKPWIRSNPPVGALGDKERPATSYVVVATRARDRWFDLDAVRTASMDVSPRTTNGPKNGDAEAADVLGHYETRTVNAAGAPPRDWWHHVDAVLDAVKDEMPEARGVHYRRALEDAGILTTLEALDVSPQGYSGAHYAVWPPELVRLLVDEMCPRRVCTSCGEPSRRIVETSYRDARGHAVTGRADFGRGGIGPNDRENRATANVITVGWSDCGHGTWRPGRILDPFVGSGTTLAVATGMGRDAVGVDLDERNAHLALERVGMFLTIDHPHREVSA